MGRTACTGATLGLFLIAVSTTAHAQSLPSPAATSTHNLLPAVPQLRLSWPVVPLKFSFSTSEQITGFSTGPELLYHAESLWLDQRSLQLLTSFGTERAFELDCRLTCQPVVRKIISLEARMPLPSMPTSYAFLRSMTFRNATSSRYSRTLDAGFAGTLNF
jgi:hypothetical protein